MKSSLKSFLVVLSLIAVLLVPLSQVPKVYSAELTVQDKALTFLADVIKLDLAKYNVTLSSHRLDYPPHLGGLAEEVVRYNLDTDESKLYITCRFRDKSLYSCGIEVPQGSSIYAESRFADVLGATKGFIERYQTYSGASYIPEMRNMLDAVDATKNTTTTMGNIKLTIVSQEVQNDPTTEAIERTTLEWVYTINGVDAPQNVVSVTFDNGVFKSFSNNWGLYKIGSTAVKLAREEAVANAKSTAKNYTLKIWVNEWVEVPFNIVEEPVSAELFMYPKETLTVYPFWRIQLYFDKLYYSAYGIEVGIWADTGETAYCESLSYAGGIPNRETSSTSTAEPSPLNMYLIATAIAIISAVAIATAILKKRSK